MRCFVIGPIGDQLADAGTLGRVAYEEALQVFEEIIKAACDPFKIDAYRADHIDDPGEIPEQIFEALRDEELVVADLTGANPNVMYELGIRHITSKCTLQIGEKDRLPFDINTIRTVQFKRTPSGLIAARNKLSALIGSYLANGCKPPTAARIMNSGGSSATPQAAADIAAASPGADAEDVESLEADEEPLGVLDAIVVLEEELPDVGARLESMNQLIVEVTELTSAYTPRMDRATKPAQRLGLAASYARELEPLAKRFDQESVEFDSRISVLDLAVDAVLRHVDDRSVEPSAIIILLDGLVAMGASASEAREQGMSGFRASLQGLEGMSRELRPVIRLLGNAVERTIVDFERVSEWGERSQVLRAALPNGDDTGGFEEVVPT